MRHSARPTRDSRENRAEGTEKRWKIQQDNEKKKKKKKRKYKTTKKKKKENNKKTCTFVPHQLACTKALTPPRWFMDIKEMMAMQFFTQVLSCCMLRLL